MSQEQFPHRLSVGISEKMNEKIEELAISRTRKGGRPISKADVMREALRYYLDEQPDAKGSRKQISKALEGQMEEVFRQLDAISSQLQVVTFEMQSQQELINKFGRALKPVIDRLGAVPRQPGGS